MKFSWSHAEIPWNNVSLGGDLDDGYCNPVGSLQRNPLTGWAPGGALRE